MSDSKIVDFIKERMVEDRLSNHVSGPWYDSIYEILVLISHKPEPVVVNSVDDYNTVSYALKSNIEWHTRKTYVERFGEEPPTNPIVLALARVWKTHPNFDLSWA